MSDTRDEASRRRRQVVETALPAVLDEAQMRAATALWEEEFDHKPGFPFAAYARRVSETVPNAPDLPELLGVLAQATRAAAAEIVRTGTPRGESAAPAAAPHGGAAAIHAAAARRAATARSTAIPAARSGAAGDLGVPPGGPRPRQKLKVDVRKVRDPTPGTATEIDESDENTIFNAVLTALVSRIDPNDRPELREHLEKTVSQCEVSAPVLIALRAWSVSVTTRVATIVAPMTRDEMRAVVHHLYIWCCELDGPRATDALFNDAMNMVARMPAAHTLDPRDLL